MIDKRLKHKKILFTTTSSDLGGYTDITEGTVLDFSPNGKYVQMHVVRAVLSDTIIRWYDQDEITVLDVLPGKVEK